MSKCDTCKERCPQAELAHQAALGRMYATNELIALVKKNEKQPMTNADRIRAMTDEELANMLTDFSNNGGWVTETGREICYERHIEWLKQPAEGDA